MWFFSSDKLSIKCQLCIKRMNLVRNKKGMKIRTIQSEIVELLRKGASGEVNARIRVEELIRQEWMLTSMATLESYLLLLQTRAAMLKKAKEIPPDMDEAIRTVIFAADRLRNELDELPAIADMLLSKFKSSFGGPEHIKKITEEETAGKNGVNEIIVQGLSAKPPVPAEKVDRLGKIAAGAGLEFDAERTLAELQPRRPVTTYMAAGGGGGGYTYSPPQQKQQPAPVPQQQPSKQDPFDQPKGPPSPPKGGGGGGTGVASGGGGLAPLPPDILADVLPPAAGGAAPAGSASAPAAAAPAASGGSVGQPQLPNPPSLKKDPWAPLPIANQNLGNEFGDRLESAAIVMRKSTGSEELRQSMSGESGSVTVGSNVGAAAEVGSKEVAAPTRAAEAPPTAALAAPAPPVEAEIPEDDLARRLEALRAGMNG